MTGEPTIFEKTFRDYLLQIGGLDVNLLEGPLGIQVDRDTLTIPLFDEPYRVSSKGISSLSGKQPSLDICVILCKYLLLCPSSMPRGSDWVSYRDLKDSGPLTVYFSNDVERAVARLFSGRLDELKDACRRMRGYTPDMTLSYDLTMQFRALPRVPLILLFNDADEEFPAQCSVLFERRVEAYLDPESLAMAGRQLFTRLKRAATP